MEQCENEFIMSIVGEIKADKVFISRSKSVLVRRIIKYVNDSVEDGIWYIRDTSSSLVGFCDVNYSRCAEDQKSIIGG